MGVLDFLKRKKKEDEFLDLGQDFGQRGGYGPGMEPSAGTAPPTGMGGELPGMPGPMPAMGGSDEIMKKDIETLSYKFDSLKATLDQINARLANIEQALRGQQGQWQY
jgi:hypothetical protein